MNTNHIFQFALWIYNLRICIRHILLMNTFKIIATGGRWRHVASYIWINIGSSYCLSPIRRQAITATWTLRNTLWWSFNQNTKLFSQENTPENVICKMSAILLRPQFIESYVWLVLILPHIRNRLVTLASIHSSIRSWGCAEYQSFKTSAFFLFTVSTYAIMRICRSLLCYDFAKRLEAASSTCACRMVKSDMKTQMPDIGTLYLNAMGPSDAYMRQQTIP